MLQFVLTSSV